MKAGKRSILVLLVGAVVAVVLIGLFADEGVRCRAHRDAERNTARWAPGEEPAPSGSEPERPSAEDSEEIAGEADDPALMHRVEVGDPLDDPDVAALLVEVRDEAGDPFPGCSVSVSCRSTPDSRRDGTTDETGRIEFRPLPLSSVDLLCGAGKPGLACQFELVKGHRVTAYIRMTRGGVAMSGRLLNRRSVGLKNVRVSLHRAEPGAYLRQNATTDQSGQFRFERLSPATYTLSVNVVGGYRNQSVVRWLEVGDRPITDYVLRVGYRSLYGTVRDASSGDELRYQIYARPVAPPVPVASGEHARGNGAYELLDLVPGETYRLRAHAAGYGMKVIRGLVLREGEERKLDIELGPEAILDILLQWGGSTSPESRIVLGLGDRDEYPVEWVTVADETGRFRFPGLPVGVHKIWIRGDFGTHEEVVHLNPGENQLSIALDGAGNKNDG